MTPAKPPANTRIIAMIVAVAMFMENMDSTIIATSLPAIARDIGTNPLALKLAMTSYLLSLAIFIPASGWATDRFGTTTVFRAAIAVFMLGSIGCAISGSLSGFVLARILQGVGGAMMTPVARMIMVRSTPRTELVGAMAWLSTPALIGPVVGPPIGGFITTYTTWHWIFLVNIPIGLIGIVLTSIFIPDIREEKRERFDTLGMVLVGSGIAGITFAFSTMGLNFIPWSVIVGLFAVGVACTSGYLAHARRTPIPALDLSLFKIPTFFASVVGGFIFRIGIGALPFLLPLMLQEGFGMSPFQSGLTTFASAVGALCMKIGATTFINTFGFRRTLTINALISSAFLAATAAFTDATPVAVMFVILVIGGFFRSLEFTSISTIAYADVDNARVSRATALVSVAQQLALSTGVAIGALCVQSTILLRGGSTGAAEQIAASDFRPAFLIVAAISAASTLIFVRLSPNAGEQMIRRKKMSGEKPVEPGTP